MYVLPFQKVLADFGHMLKDRVNVSVSIHAHGLIMVFEEDRVEEFHETVDFEVGRFFPQTGMDKERPLVTESLLH